MNNFQRSLLALVLAAGAAAPAAARNDRMLLQIAPALNGQASRQMLDPSLPVSFGSASGVTADKQLPPADVRGVADPFGAVNTNAGGSRQRRSDEATCLDAFRKAVLELQQRARRMGATSVVGVVSNYKDGVLDSREVFECRIGHSRGFVDLRGSFARTAAVAAQGAVVAPPPAGARPALEDVDAVPNLSEAGRREYRAFLTWAQPRAFALSPTGYYYATSGNVDKDGSGIVDPVARALAGCERNSKMQCKLYAVNTAVVWNH